MGARTAGRKSIQTKRATVDKIPHSAKSLSHARAGVLQLDRCAVRVVSRDEDDNEISTAKKSCLVRARPKVLGRNEGKSCLENVLRSERPIFSTH